MKHKWGEVDREQYRSTRICINCGLVKMTRHEPGVIPWTEWKSGGFQIFPSSGTPECKPAKVAAKTEAVG